MTNARRYAVALSLSLVGHGLLALLLLQLPGPPPREAGLLDTRVAAGALCLSLGSPASRKALAGPDEDFVSVVVQGPARPAALVEASAPPAPVGPPSTGPVARP
jgi:hypothetical protein